MLTAAVLSLFGTIDASHFAGALTGEAPPPAAAPADLSGVPVAELTPEQLLTERNRLDGFRTIFVGPTVMTAVGGVVVIFAAVFGVAGIIMAVIPAVAMPSMALTTLQIAGYVLIGLSGAALVAGGIVLAIGLTTLFPALARRREAMERRDEIQRRLDALDPAKAPEPPAKTKPSPNDVLWRGPESGLLLATF